MHKAVLSKVEEIMMTSKHSQRRLSTELEATVVQVRTIFKPLLKQLFRRLVEVDLLFKLMIIIVAMALFSRVPTTQRTSEVLRGNNWNNLLTRLISLQWSLSKMSNPQVKESTSNNWKTVSSQEIFVNSRFTTRPSPEPRTLSIRKDPAHHGDRWFTSKETICWKR